MTFTFRGATNHELVYEISGSDDSSALDAEPTMIADSNPQTPIGRFVAQQVVDNAEAQALLLGIGYDGEHTVPPALIGEVSIQGMAGQARWDLQAGMAPGNGLRISVLCTGTGTATMRVRTKHTWDR